jgi:hypothetical protein
MFKKIKGILALWKTHKEGGKIIDKIVEASTSVSLTTAKLCFDEYKNEMDPQIANVLAAQVMNYLTGNDVEEVYLKSQEPLKSRIGLIKGMVPERASKLLDNDNELKELIVHNLHFKQHLDWAYKETIKYLSISQKAQIDFLLKKYGDDVPYYTLDADEFSNMVNIFIIKRFG